LGWQVFEFTAFEACRLALKNGIRRYSLYFSLIAGNQDAETGSQVTVSSATHKPLLQNDFFSGRANLQTLGTV
jgi:hypothetical protein